MTNGANEWLDDADDDWIVHPGDELKAKEYLVVE